MGYLKAESRPERQLKLALIGFELGLFGFVFALTIETFSFRNPLYYNGLSSFLAFWKLGSFGIFCFFSSS
jgi:hypothetical protein